MRGTHQAVSGDEQRGHAPEDGLKSAAWVRGATGPEATRNEKPKKAFEPTRYPALESLRSIESRPRGSTLTLGDAETSP